MVGRPLSRRMGYIYFIHAPSVDMVKIGWSRSDPDARLAAIRTCSPIPLERYALMHGIIAKEGWLHGRFAHLRAHSEWFRLADDLKVFIAAEASGWEELLAADREAERQRADRAATPRPEPTPEEFRRIMAANEEFFSTCAMLGVDPYTDKSVKWPECLR